MLGRADKLRRADEAALSMKLAQIDVDAISTPSPVCIGSGASDWARHSIEWANDWTLSL